LFVLSKEAEKMWSMKTSVRAGRNRGLTLIELFVVVAVIAVVAVVFLPPMLIPPRRHRINASCYYNLRQIGLAFRTWEGDYQDHYPMTYFTNEAGMKVFADPANFCSNFMVMSNELNNPKLLVCPEDKKRTVAVDFGTNFGRTNISYFLGLDADETFPRRLLSGDRNLTNGMKLKNGIMELATNQTMGWTMERHQGNGNVLFSDGSVQQLSAQGLKEAAAKTGLATNRLAMP
jgi:prepilin-type N-terminal cleavage/methylation domain-containing protein/prepilin-type processing-associated H-X9-DG protein